ncbi:ABC transporter substrate-binding protein [Radicibacter daui]|uniref:ABC transporter substrate-binding protein n=1 Tax=Radicibacter daui TaxID=3064829 RepID=UPI004046E4AF
MTPVTFGRRAMLAGLSAALLAANARPRRALAQDAPSFPNAFGTTVLSRPVQRVVSIGYTTQDALLALGIVPVGIREWFGDQPYGVWPWARAQLGAAAPVLLKGNIGLEKVAVLKPDLIVAIGSGINAAEYAALSRVAPVLMQPPEAPAYGMAWDQMALLIGRAVGKAQRAEDLVAAARQQFAALRGSHPDWVGRTAVAAYHYGGETGVFAPADTRGQFLSQLGFQPPPAMKRLEEAGGFYHKLSPEDLSALECDLLVWVSSYDKAPDLAALPMRKALKAHLDGREVFAGDLLAAAMSFGSILSLPFAASELEADISAAVDGDPETPVASAVRAGLAP